MRRTDAPRSERGVAILTVITALAALIVIAVPFLITMRVSYERSEQNRARQQAQNDADSLMRFLESYLVRTTDRVEIANREAQRTGNNSDPEQDSQAEIEPSLADAALALGVRAEDIQNPYGTILGWEVVDENAKFHLNGVSFFALGNLLGLSRVSQEIGESDTTITLEDARQFPSRGYVLIDREVISYDARQGNRLTGCRRGLNADMPEHSKADVHTSKALAVNYAAWAITYLPLMPQKVGAEDSNEVMILYSPYRTLDVAGISKLTPKGVDIPLLTQAEWERKLQPYVTIWSKGPVAEGWSNAQAQNGNTALPRKADTPDWVPILNTAYFNRGTVVRFEEKAENKLQTERRREDEMKVFPRRIDFGMLRKVDVSNVHMYGKAHRSFRGIDFRIYYRTPIPVNINTASREVLVAMFQNLRQFNTPDDWVRS
ncbi:MAG: hypothetical protein ACE10D_07695, partial [Planctomycetota bacterium]